MKNPHVSSPAQGVSIGGASARSGVSARMIRHYESLGFLPDVLRTDSGYRQYSDADIHSLCFIHRARALGFSMAAIGELLSLWHDRARSSASVRKIAQAHLAELEARIASMQAMHQVLADLVKGCHGDARPDCPILNDLAQR